MVDYLSLIQKVGIMNLVSAFVITACILLIYMRVYRNFKEAKEVKKSYEVKSPIETITMSLFFLTIFVVIKLSLGKIPFENDLIKIFGLLIFVLGTYVNIKGRVNLGKNWGNEVVIYERHTLVTNGVYKFVRHPLYASIIWMIFAIAIIYSNYLVLILNILTFIPAMYYRAKQEEKELIKRFSEYEKYRKEVGMFFPKFWR